MNTAKIRTVIHMHVLVLALATARTGTVTAAGARDLSDLAPYLKKSTSWYFETLSREVPVRVYHGGGIIGPAGTPVIAYLMNDAWERVGQEPDLSILADYIGQNFIVITVDFGKDQQAGSPCFDSDLWAFFRAVYGFRTDSLLEGTGLQPREYRCFFLPAGYRVATDLVYWELDRHAAHGTMEFIMDSYNRDIVPKLPGLQPVDSPGKMVDRFGNPFDFTVKMDIIYPSRAKEQQPTMVFSSWHASRNPNGEPIGYLPHFAGFTTRGYTYVVMGHCYNPCVVHFFHYAKFTLDEWNGLACYTAAMRYLNANAEKYAIDTEHIGMCGHSKGEYAVTRLSDPGHAGGQELSRFEGFPEGSPEPQPWPGYPSSIAAGYQSMGMGLFEPGYITPGYMPTIVACGEKERDLISKEAHPAFVKRLEELDVNHIELFMKDLGHEVPYGTDERLGADLYLLMHDFFDRYLKVDEHLPPVALLISPADGAAGVSPGSTVTIDFAPVIDSRSIARGKGVRILREGDDQPLEGSWRVVHGGTRFIFTPGEELEQGTYRIEITSGIRDSRGTPLAAERKTVFTVGSVEETFNTVILAGMEWMEQNLDVDHFRNGDPIPEAVSDEEWAKAGREGSPAFCHYENDTVNGSIYGKLYNWFAVNDPRGLAPEGWHVSSDEDWRYVTDHLGGEDAAGTMMKSPDGWKNRGNGSNSSGFTGLPGGCRDYDGTFRSLGEVAFWWTTTAYDRDLAWYRCIDRSPWYVYRTNYHKPNGLSVRCVKDKTNDHPKKT